MEATLDASTLALVVVAEDSTRADLKAMAVADTTVVVQHITTRWASSWAGKLNLMAAARLEKPFRADYATFHPR